MSSCAGALPEQHTSVEGLSALAALRRLHLSNCAWIGYALSELNAALAVMLSLQGLVSLCVPCEPSEVPHKAQHGMYWQNANPEHVASQL